MDIGCGLAGIDVFLCRHYGPELELALLDREGRSPTFHGFREQAAFYNSLAAARALLCANGVPGGRVRTYDADRDGFPDGGGFDLVISLLSRGFHYPVTTYLPPVVRSLAPGGRLIIDVRHGTDGEAQLAAAFGRAPAPIAQAARHRRLVVTAGPRP
jgi:SAM-dependent methyltransferase